MHDSYIPLVVKFNCNLIWTFELEDQSHILFPMTGYTGCMYQNQLPTTSKFMRYHDLCVCTLTLIFDLEGQGYVLFSMVDFYGAWYMSFERFYVFVYLPYDLDL